MMNPRLSLTFSDGGSNCLDSSILEALAVWFRICRYRQLVSARHADICWSTRDGGVWNWKRIF